MTLAWARMTPDLIDELSLMPPREAALALKAALERHSAMVSCQGCGTRYDVHGDLRDVDSAPCPVCGGRLELSA